jgi:hypothetical protein
VRRRIMALTFYNSNGRGRQLVLQSYTAGRSKSISNMSIANRTCIIP